MGRVYSVGLCVLCLPLILVSEWLIFSLTATDDCSDAKVILFIVFEFPVKSM